MHPGKWCGRPKRVLRGGSWANNNPENLSCAYRNNNTPDNRNNNIGFRCVWVGLASAARWRHRRFGEVPGGERPCPASAKRSPNRPFHAPRRRLRRGESVKSVSSVSPRSAPAGKTRGDGRWPVIPQRGTKVIARHSSRSVAANWRSPNVPLRSGGLASAEGCFACIPGRRFPHRPGSRILAWRAGLETRDTADSEVCATTLSLALLWGRAFRLAIPGGEIQTPLKPPGSDTARAVAWAAASNAGVHA
ncbi:MAG: SUMF1/EgtB/PvdO family nonheme iron enzyme [Verrucomicrobiales bacterium]|nr:SUMF1/EgtB/PvdO family nonheme iron enzyme [Verrucomicrobiales bacterium]MCP5525024.1 SUMF1/EgtB/PvdO family nonheme iron enzyme [Verrucomicrobiales bacterium]